ncbi:MAG TPA: Sec-independent protein translocase protein TatB, partial [Myxococcota bacterium]|nr:Sec-independent protein translocase protein TatB [Myxococcota bacterium]
MTDIGFVELVLVAVVTLVFVGPEDLPEVIRYLGKMYGQFQRMAAELRRSFTLEADRMDEERRLRDLIRRRKEAEAERRAHDEAHGTRAQPDQVDQAARAARAAQAAAAQ